MPPKPRPARKPSTTIDQETVARVVEKPPSDKALMPPPPVPPAPLAILEAEINALSQNLKNAAVKTGQIFRFYSDTRRLGIHRHAPYPPRSLTSSLAHEVGKYDQLCDAVDSYLLRAITVLQRDLAREQAEQARLREAEKAALLRDHPMSLEANKTLVPSLADAEQIHYGATVEGEPSNEGLDATQTRTSPPVSLTRARRQSKISLSTLHRSPFPLKLDLSSAALRLSMDEAGKGLTGLGSPVTLAPKSARPMAFSEIPPELMAAFANSVRQDQSVDIDFTMGDSVQSSDIPGMELTSGLPTGRELGNSAEKPIELDLDMDVNMTDLDLFGDPSNEDSEANAGIDSLFTPATATPSLTLPENAASEQGGTMDMAILDALSAVEGSGPSAELFASLNAEASVTMQPTVAPHELNLAPKSSDTAVSSPSSILAGVSNVSHDAANTQHSNSAVEAPPGGASTSFDLGPLDMADMSGFSPVFFNDNAADMDIMEQILNMSDASTEGGNVGDKQSTLAS